MAKEDILIITKDQFAKSTSMMIHAIIDVFGDKAKDLPEIKFVYETTLESLDQHIEGEEEFIQELSKDYEKFAE